MKVLSKNYRKRKAYFYHLIDSKELQKELNKEKNIEEKEKRFEKEFAKVIGVKKSLLFGSGNHALMTSLNSLNIEKKKEVLVQAYTCKQVHEIINKRYKTLPVDIDETYNIDLKKAKQKIGKDTKILQAIYSYGKAIDSKKLTDFCKDNNLTLIEDCAHSLGAKNGKKAGSFGEISIFSLRKNVPVGNGGVLCTNNKEIYERCMAERNADKRNNAFGKKLLETKISFWKNFFPDVDFPYILLSKLGYGGKEVNKERLDLFEISLALVSIKMLPKIINQTRKNTELLKEELGEEKFVFTEDGKKEINVATRVPVYFKKPRENIESIWFRLQEEGWETGLFYTKDFSKNIGKNYTQFPVSKKVSEYMVPIGVQGLKKEQVIELAERIKSFSK